MVLSPRVFAKERFRGLQMRQGVIAAVEVKMKRLFGIHALRSQQKPEEASLNQVMGITKERRKTFLRSVDSTTAFYYGILVFPTIKVFGSFRFSYSLTVDKTTYIMNLNSLERQMLSEGHENLQQKDGSAI